MVAGTITVKEMKNKKTKKGPNKIWEREESKINIMKREKERERERH